MATESARIVDVLRERSPFRPFLAALTLSAIGDGIAVAALTLYVQSTEGTGVAVGALLLASTLPRLLGPLIGALADRLDAIRLMVGCDLGQAAIYGLIALTLPALAPLLLLVLVASLLTGGTSASRGAILPALVERDRLLGANVLLGAGFNLQVVIGPLVGALLFAGGGAGLALGVNAATFLVSASLLAIVRTKREPRSADGGLLSDVREALAFVRREPTVRTLILSLTLALAFLSIDNVALVFLVRETLEGAPTAYGLVFAAFGAGMLLGSLAMVLSNPRSPARMFLLALTLSGAGTILTGLAPAIVAAAAFQAIAGIGNSLDNAASDTLIQHHIPPEMLGRVFGLFASMAYLGSGLAAAAGGPLLDLTSPRFVFVLGGVGGLLVVAFAGPIVLRSAPPQSRAG